MYIHNNSNLGYNHAFGKYIKNRQELRDAINEHKDKTGEDLIEVGNENINSYSKKHRNHFEWDDAEIAQALDKEGITD